ncbi:MAG: response regulator, partial [Alphaproteobacteria bacterium]
SSAGVTRANMRRDGAQNVIWRRTYQGVEEALEEGGIDIALLDASLPGGNAIDLARRVRFGELGGDPFVPIIITTWRAEQSVIDAALNAGADDVLLKPLSSLTIAKRIHRIGDQRKPFVAITGYVGPIRAGAAATDQNAETFHPPNTLMLLRASGTPDLTNIEANFENAQRRLAALRLEVCAQDISRAAHEALNRPVLDGAPEISSKALLTGADALRSVTNSLPYDDLRDAVSRLAALATLAGGTGEQAARAAKLSIEIADAISLTIQHSQSNMIQLPDDIVQRIDARFPDLQLA